MITCVRCGGLTTPANYVAGCCMPCVRQLIAGRVERDGTITYLAADVWAAVQSEGRHDHRREAEETTRPAAALDQ